MPIEPTPLDTVLECLQRSGYLLESTLVKALTDHDYFVEPNQAIKDPRTGKSREIDLIAEYYARANPDHHRVCVKTYFVVEVIANKFPVVLMTERPGTPNEDFENQVKFAFTPEPNKFSTAFDIYEERGPARDKLFSQYCALTPKNRGDKELMASHPDDMYSSFQKLAEYAEAELNEFRNREGIEDDEVWRIFSWHPMLVLGGQLIVVKTGVDGEPVLTEVRSAFLEFNWHEGDERRTTVIEVVTRDAFLDQLASIVEKDAEWEVKLNELRKVAHQADPFSFNH